MSSNELLGTHFLPKFLFIDEAGQATDADIAIPVMRFNNDLQAVFFNSE